MSDSEVKTGAFTFGFETLPHLLQIKQITFIVTSPQHKCLGEWNSYERAPDSAKNNNRQFTYGQTVQKNNNNLHMDRQCKKLHWSIYSAPDSAKKQQQQFTYGQTVQKTALEHLQCSRQCKKTTTTIYIWTDSAKKQQQFTYGQYIFTDCTEDNVQNTHTYTQYT